MSAGRIDLHHKAVDSSAESFDVPHALPIPRLNLKMRLPPPWPSESQSTASARDPPTAIDRSAHIPADGRSAQTPSVLGVHHRSAEDHASVKRMRAMEAEQSAKLVEPALKILAEIKKAASGLTSIAIGFRNLADQVIKLEEGVAVEDAQRDLLKARTELSEEKKRHVLEVIELKRLVEIYQAESVADRFDLETARSELKRLGDLYQAKSAADRFDLETARSEHAAELKRLETDHQAEIDRLKAVHQAEIDRLKADHQGKLNDQAAHWKHKVDKFHVAVERAKRKLV